MGSAARVFGAAMMAVAPAAFAMSLGEVEVRSALGEPLDARVPLTFSPGETVDATCFTLARDPEPGVPVLAEGLLTVERIGDRSELRIRSSASIYEPAMRVRVRAACPGQPGEALRQYSVLLDPRHGDPVIANVPSITASLDARTGDTLGAIATQVFPRNRAARDRYLQAIREVNPALASLGDSDAIPAGASIALPDLRTFSSRGTARTATAASPNVAAAQAPVAQDRPKVEREKTARRKPRAERTKSAHGKTAPSRPAGEPPVSTAAASPPGDFVLRLSGGSVDLARSREVDDKTRAQLRERLMILESDDQVAAVLALRNRLAQLEQRVNELQLKLAQMPASFPARPATQTAAPAAAPTAAPQAAVEPVKPPDIAATPQPSTATSAATTPASSPASAETAPAAEASKPGASTDTPVSSTAAGTAASTEAASAVKTAPAVSKPVALPPKPAGTFDLRASWQSYGLWIAFILVLALLMWLVWRITHRPEPEYDVEAWDQPAPTTEPGEYEVAVEGDEHLQTQALAAPDAGALRRRYIEERFPEVASGTLSLSDPASVVKGARLLYQDGAMPRAVELLQFAIEEHPAEVRPWLALFEIYRLERQSTEFAELARRFYEEHGNTEYWRKVRYFGREIDPGNFLYREDVDALQTIAPGSARREDAESFDPARENWLDTPVNFDNERLANELRHALMSGAGVADEDLAPNPLPALRDAETFTVA